MIALSVALVLLGAMALAAFWLWLDRQPRPAQPVQPSAELEAKVTDLAARVAALSLKAGLQPNRRD